MTDLRIVVAGHVDHGKSTLIGRLLYETGSLPQSATDRLGRVDGSHTAAAFAFVTDQLSEEQEGSFTLDTAQAHLRTAARDYTLIDTPGHREFLKNMVTGATWADAAILVVDAVEGPLPQTYLHAYLISMLGIRQVIVAINKMDMVSYDRHRFHLLAQRFSRHLARTGITPRALVPISAQQGDQVVRRSGRMPWNRGPTLVEAMGELIPHEPHRDRSLRFLVQCTFPVHGQRAILGRVTSGRLRRGQGLVFSPGGHETTVVSVLLGQCHTDRATSGQSIGLLLQDPIPVQRGHVGSDIHDTPGVANRLRARVFWTGRQPLHRNDRIAVLCGTQDRRGYVETILKVIDPTSLETRVRDAACVNDSQAAELVIRTDSPMCMDPFRVLPDLGRFAILQEGRIAGAGVVDTP